MRPCRCSGSSRDASLLETDILERSQGDSVVGERAAYVWMAQRLHFLGALATIHARQIVREPRMAPELREARREARQHGYQCGWADQLRKRPALTVLTVKIAAVPNRATATPERHAETVGQICKKGPERMSQVHVLMR